MESSTATRWSFSMQGTLLVFFFAAFAAIGLCASAFVRKRRIQTEQSECNQEKEVAVPNATEQSASGWREIKKVLFSSLCLSNASQAVEPERRNWQGKEVTVAVTEAMRGWEEHGSMTNTPPLWQRRILMGERCEMPKFSGLILYDERGHPLQNNSTNRDTLQLEKPAAPVTTLKDLL